MSNAGPWSTIGYTGSVPTISTTTLTDDTATSDGSNTGGSWSTGNAATVNTGSLEVKILDDAATDFNCVVGHTTYDSEHISNNSLALTVPEVVTSLRFNENGKAIPNNDETYIQDYVAGDIFKIVISGSTASFFKNESSTPFDTFTITPGSYYGYSTSDNGNAYSFQLLNYASATTTTLLPPPYANIGLVGL